MKKTVVFVLFSLLGVLVAGCAAPTPVVPSTVVVTVVNTVPVEVTRLAPVQQTVEVTRQVVVTQLVEVPVTLTPSPTPEVTSTSTTTVTPTPASTYQAMPLYPTATFPVEKKAGFSRLKLVNKTNDSIEIQISGPFFQTYTLSPGDQSIEPVKEGMYQYTVTIEGSVIFRGTMNITNPDKHELHVYPDRVVFLVP